MASTKLFICFCIVRGFEEKDSLENLHSVLFCSIKKRSKPEILSRIAQATAALTRLNPVWNDRRISLSSKIRLVNHGPSQQSSKGEYKPWK